ncbi:zinc metalloproteinase nas-36-like [Ostrea edulis]|uniref:zinc metalloproteinase nas-36-like n=1 Tax=Ostrea edulis TaxID=37623 RepID=UPI0024AEA264|nr:zinc metalloproteinase nas-36-like [Ostrea edulis]
MLRIAILVAILFAPRANTLDDNENGETALKRLLGQDEGSLGQLGESDAFESDMEEILLNLEGEKENMDPEMDIEDNDINSSGSTEEEEEEDDELEEGEYDDDDDQNDESVSTEDDSGTDLDESEGTEESGSTEDDSTNESKSSESQTEEKSESIEDDSGNEDAVEYSLENSLSQLNEMIKKANPELTESTKRSFEDEDMIEGDIKLDKESAAELVEFYKRNPQYLNLDSNVTDRSFTDAMSKRKVLRSGKWRMPIKYRIESSSYRTVVQEAIRIWKQETCLQFSEKTTFSPPGIKFTGRYAGCWAHIGRRSFGNTVNLGMGCRTVGIAAHEIGHAIGFYHEQSRPDRNNYVTIKKENIKDGKVHNFLIKPSTTYGTKYDYGSIMHYRDTAFAKTSGLKTITAKQPNFERTMGQRTALSFYDIKAANYHYCQGKCTGGLKWSKCRNDGYRDPKNCKICKCPEGWTGRYCTILSSSRPSSRSCGSRYRTAGRKYRSLQSPGYSSSGYTTTAECTWKIRAPIGKRVKLYFSGSFKIKCHSRCLDFVEVRYKSLSATGPRFCCYQRPRRTFTSTGREMLILFRTFSGSRQKGFRARYKYV